jgi:lysophosphatidate acyltransferase
VKVWFFPEGLTSKKLLPFKKGAFRAAIDKKIPIVPVVFSAHSFVDWDNFKAEEGTVSKQ